MLVLFCSVLFCQILPCQAAMKSDLELDLETARVLKARDEQKEAAKEQLKSASPHPPRDDSRDDKPRNPLDDGDDDRIRDP